VGEVRAVAPDGRGGWFLGGDFTSVCGQSRRGIAQVDAAGNLTAWNPNPARHASSFEQWCRERFS
jgi:hypothetical protein